MLGILFFLKLGMLNFEVMNEGADAEHMMIKFYVFVSKTLIKKQGLVHSGALFLFLQEKCEKREETHVVSKMA
jgi:hypothetical protein